MRLSCRSFSLLHTAFLLSLLGIPCSVSWGQTPSQQSARLPAKWNDAVRALAGKIATAAAPSHAVTLEVKNISTLSSAEASAIQAALRAELEQRHLQVAPDAASEKRIEVTLSQGYADLVWVAKVQRGQGDEREPEIVIVAVEKAMGGLGGEGTDSLSLTRKIVWEQRAKILDFGIAADPPGNLSRLLVLEPEKLVFYRADDARWELERMVPIPHSTPWPRDVSGWIDTLQNRAYIGEIVCSGEFLQPESVKCEQSDLKHDVRREIRYKIPDREDVDTAAIVTVCGESLGVLATGTGDWTQPDSIQGYLSADGRLAASGTPIEIDGPVMWLYRGDTPGSARAVVRDLNTGNYEADIVTATCNH
jgi:hypothetical protein